MAPGPVATAAGVMPTPHHATVGAAGPAVMAICLDATVLAEHATLDALAARLFAPLAIAPAGSCACEWRITITGAAPALDDDAAAVWAVAHDQPEGFVLSTSAVDGRALTTITAATERGAWDALLVAQELLVTPPGGAPRVPDALVVDYPELRHRGILEGFYGTPYSIEDRATTIRLASRLRQDVYIYGPKTDDFARTRWAEPYPAEQAAAIAAAAETARGELVRFVWSVSPGLPFGNVLPMQSIVYSSDADFARLTAKIESVRALGVREFALFLDDTTGFLVWPEDIARFGSLAQAHAYLIDRLDDYLHAIDPASRLLVVGSEYTSFWPTWRAYNEELGTLVHDGIEMLWTGPGIYTIDMTAADMEPIDAALHREVSIWDNQPTSVGPLQGRSADLPRTVDSFYSNPVVNELDRNPPSAFWSVQGTIADYTWNPAAYDPRTDFDRWQTARAAWAVP